MSEVALQTGDDAPPVGGRRPSGAWIRPALLAAIGLSLLIALGLALTQVIAARVPEQRATLEKLITDRTGLAVRFDNVHFAWGMEGASAVFERVELTDPVRDRVRVVAPELRVEFDAWDFLRHQRFSLGHVTLSSPDIDIIGDAEPRAATAPAPRNPRAAPGSPPATDEEAALVRRFTSWSELMPVGRVEVEGARVHLYQRGERTARHHFSLSQAVIRRGTHDFNAFGTLLLSQDIGQSLFVSARLEGLAADPESANAVAGTRASGELRLIARRVVLDKLGSLWDEAQYLRGRGTVDARLTLREGRVHDGQWQLSGRELQMPGGARFDHFTVQGRLRHLANGFDLTFEDLQVTRGARLERAPELRVQLELSPGTLRVAGVTARASYLPFLAGEFLAALAPAAAPWPAATADWALTAGEVRDLRFVSRRAGNGQWRGEVRGVDLVRRSDQARLQGLSARVEIQQGVARMEFTRGAAVDPPVYGLLTGGEPRALRLAGTLTARENAVEFQDLELGSGAASLVMNGSWGARPAPPLTVSLSGVDHALLLDAVRLAGIETPALFADLRAGRVAQGSITLVPQNQGAAADWARSRGSLRLEGLASQAASMPALVDAAGSLDFARGTARLRLTGGQLEGLTLTEALIDWPRRGAPRLRARAAGDLRAPLLHEVLASEGLQGLTGGITLEAEARGEAALRDPDSWRVTARVDQASLPLGARVPALRNLAGNVRVSGGQLRGLSLAGEWLGGPIEIQTRRAGAGGVDSALLKGTADAGLLLGLMDPNVLAARLDGSLSWSGVLQQREAAPNAPAGWKLTVNSDLAGMESRLPVPWEKSRGRALPLAAELRFVANEAANGATNGTATRLEEFSVNVGGDSLRGRLSSGAARVRFDVQGVVGDWQAAEGSEESRLAIDQLDLRRAPAVLAVAGALLPADSLLRVNVAEMVQARPGQAPQGLGALTASLQSRADGIEFSFESTGDSPHRIDASGRCATNARCALEFALDSTALPLLLGDARLPVEWPARTLHAAGEVSWPSLAAMVDAPADTVRDLTGRFEIETEGEDRAHQLLASAQLADGQIALDPVQGTGPATDTVFHGRGQVGLLARTYELTVEFEHLSLAASAVPPPARLRLSRAWSNLRSSVAHSESAESRSGRKVQWRGSWDGVDE